MNKEDYEIITIDYEDWYIYKISNVSYEYRNFPPPIIGEEIEYKITVKKENDHYEVIAREYNEYYGSGGWEEWTDYKDKVMKTITEDAKNRINAEKIEKPQKEKLLWEIE